MPMNPHQKLSHKRIKRLIKTIMEREGCIRKTAVRDLLTDIRHYCEAESVNFHTAAKGAYEVYLEERATPL